MRGCAPAPQLGRDGQLKLQENPKGWAKEPEWRTIRISINKSKTTADRINPWFTVVFKISRCQRRDFREEKTNHKLEKTAGNQQVFLRRSLLAGPPQNTQRNTKGKEGNRSLMFSHAPVPFLSYSHSTSRQISSSPAEMPTA